MTDNSKYPEEGSKMDNGFGTQDILTGRGLGLGGFGYGQGYGGAGGAFSVGANSVRLDSNGRAAATGLENLLDQNQFSATNKNIVDGFSAAADSRAQNVNRVSDAQFRAELRSSDQMAMLTRDNADARAEAAKCCCDLSKDIATAAAAAALCCCDAKLLAAENKADILASASRDKAEILLSISAIKDRELNAANAELTALKTINALQSN